MRKALNNLMRLGAWIGGVLAAAILLGGIVILLSLLTTDDAQLVTSFSTLWSLLPEGLSIMGFSILAALTAVLISFPLSWSLSVVICYLVPSRWMNTLNNITNGLSAVPAVVFGYMSLSYFVPNCSSPWWAVVLTLILMSLMRQTLALNRVHLRHFQAVEAAYALGAYFYETIIYTVRTRAHRSYLAVALRMMTRGMCEGVAILLVVSAYSDGADTLPTALMKALGVTGENGSMHWVLLLAGLLLLFVLLGNTLISVCVQGGRHGKEKNAQ